MTAENRKNSGNKGSPYRKFKKIKPRFETKTHMYNNKLQKPTAKVKQ